MFAVTQYRLQVCKLLHGIVNWTTNIYEVGTDWNGCKVSLLHLFFQNYIVRQSTDKRDAIILYRNFLWNADDTFRWQTHMQNPEKQSNLNYI